MASNMSTFTSLVMDGTEYEFELEPVFFNTKTQLVEPLSSSPRSVPRDEKKPIEKVTKIDEKNNKIENEKK